MNPLVAVERLTRDYVLPRAGLFGARAMLRAVDDVSFTMTAGRSLGVVGESGSGKSTLARLVMALERPSSGRVRLEGEDLFELPRDALRRRRRKFQMVFQDPNSSLDPRRPIARIVAEPLDVAEPGLSRAEILDRVRAMLDAVGLPGEAASRYPHEFSGGQRQRIALARALITEPALIVADEPVSALDVSIQAQVLNLLMDLQERRGVTYLFISHNLAVVEHVADDVLVMVRGRVVERGPAGALFASPAHPYTKALVDAVPDLADADRPAPEPLPDGEAAPGGCVFASRCPRVQPRCRIDPPLPREIAPGRLAACHFV